MHEEERAAIAAETGRRMADDVFAERLTELQERAAVRRETRLERAVVAAEAERTAAMDIPAATMALLAAAAPSNGVLIAEGDSWFDYPRRDVVSALRSEHSFDVRSVAHYGHRVEDMAYGGRQLHDFSQKLEDALRAGNRVRAVLLSGGGNDIAGDEFALLINHALSPIGGINDDVVRGIIDVRIQDAYVTLISAINRIAQRWLNRVLPVIVHGYANPVPDGRGFAGGFWLLPGPWLEPGFRQKGFVLPNGRVDLARCTPMMEVLIARFNAMLQGLERLPQLEGAVRYVDLRPVLNNDLQQYEEDWANELHPTQSAFRRVAERIAAAVP